MAVENQSNTIYRVLGQLMTIFSHVTFVAG
jgi:hypothetical protein